VVRSLGRLNIGRVRPVESRYWAEKSAEWKPRASSMLRMRASWGIGEMRGSHVSATACQPTFPFPERASAISENAPIVRNVGGAD
jgi:hypothetical protein